MPRSVWHGVISFGMVAMPVRLYLANDSGSGGVSFRLLCPEHRKPIKQRRWCSAVDHEVGWSSVLRGFEYTKDTYVVLTDEDLSLLPLPTKSVIDISGFVPAGALVTPVSLQGSYYIEPEPSAAKPYALLRDILREGGHAGVAKLAIRDREHLVSISTFERALVLNTLVWPEDIRSSADLKVPEEVALTDKERQLARHLVDAMLVEFQPTEYTDDYRKAVLRLVEAKVNGGDEMLALESTPSVETSPSDLMALLQASVNARLEARTAPGIPVVPVSKPAAAKRVRAKSASV